jgi:glycosyltransferase involved in cell wall biosynthesis
VRVGTIAIVADFGNFNWEIVEKGKFDYVFHYNDIDSFANRIVDICKNQQNYSELYDNSYNTFLNELNFEK